MNGARRRRRGLAERRIGPRNDLGRPRVAPRRLGRVAKDRDRPLECGPVHRDRIQPVADPSGPRDRGSPGLGVDERVRRARYAGAPRAVGLHAMDFMGTAVRMYGRLGFVCAYFAWTSVRLRTCSSKRIVWI